MPSASVNYHANYVKPSWGRRLQRVRQIGAHIFYGAPLGGHVKPGAEPGERTPVAPRGLVWAPIAALDRAYATLSGQTQGDGEGR